MLIFSYIIITNELCLMCLIPTLFYIQQLKDFSLLNSELIDIILNSSCIVGMSLRLCCAHNLALPQLYNILAMYQTGKFGTILLGNL